MTIINARQENIVWKDPAIRWHLCTKEKETALNYAAYYAVTMLTSDGETYSIKPKRGSYTLCRSVGMETAGNASALQGRSSDCAHQHHLKETGRDHQRKDHHFD